MSNTHFFSLWVVCTISHDPPISRLWAAATLRRRGAFGRAAHVVARMASASERAL
jgi:hypothetical protein